MHTHITQNTHFRFLLDMSSVFGLRPDRTAMCVLGARRVRAAALFCPPVEEPEREAGPAAMGHPPWGSEHGLYVVVVDAGCTQGAGAEATTAMEHEAGGSQPSMGTPWTRKIVR